MYMIKNKFNIPLIDNVHNINNNCIFSTNVGNYFKFRIKRNIRFINGNTFGIKFYKYKNE